MKVFPNAFLRFAAREEPQNFNCNLEVLFPLQHLSRPSWRTNTRVFHCFQSRASLAARQLSR